MKFLISLIMVVVVMVGCAGGVGSREPSALVKRVENSTVALIAAKDGDYRIYCSGVWIGVDKIITANHCAKGYFEIVKGVDPEGMDMVGLKMLFSVSSESMGYHNNPSGMHAAVVVKSDDTVDLAVLKVVGDLGSVPAHDVARLADRNVGVGSDVVIVGHPIGLDYSFVRGVVSAYRKDIDGSDFRGTFMQISAPVYFGNSGGGVFNMDGELLGIASFIVRAPNTAFFVELDSLKEILAD